MTDAEMFQTFCALTKERRDLEDALGVIKERILDLQERIMEKFTRDGISSVKVVLPDSAVTLYLHRQTWVKPLNGDYEAACTALKAVGLASFVKETFSTQTVSAYVREQQKEGRELPRILTEALDMRADYSIRLRQA